MQLELDKAPVEFNDPTVTEAVVSNERRYLPAFAPVIAVVFSNGDKTVISCLSHSAMCLPS